MPIKLIFLCFICLLIGCQHSGSEWRQSAVIPAKPGSTVHLRVVHAVNERFPKMSPEQLRIMLASAQQTTRKNFGVNVEFSDVAEIGVDRLFALIPPPVREARAASIYDFKSGKGDKHKLADGILTTLKQHGTTLEDALAFARPYLPATAHPRDMREFANLLSEVMLERLQYWVKIKAMDGAPVLDGSPYNEWIYWDTLGYGDLPYDLVISNQLIASAEYVDVDVHSAIRGGLSVGTTTYSRNSQFGSFIFWTTFPFTDSSDSSKNLRDGEVYSDREAAELSGAYLAHEIGHLLFRFGHPFGQKACLMNPVNMLRFREWHHQIDGAACQIGSRPEMTFGAVPEYYNADWLRMAQKQ